MTLIKPTRESRQCKSWNEIITSMSLKLNEMCERISKHLGLWYSESRENKIDFDFRNSNHSRATSSIVTQKHLKPYWAVFLFQPFIWCAQVCHCCSASRPFIPICIRLRCSLVSFSARNLIQPYSRSNHYSATFVRPGNNTIVFDADSPHFH